jgi:hypothetical protein
VTQVPYFQIKVGVLLPDTPLPFDIYVSVNKKFIKYLPMGEKLTPDKIS